MTTPIAGPRSKDEIVTAFETLADTGARFWGCFAPEEFVAPIGDAWSPSDNVRHLAKSTKAVVNALKLPRIVPTLMFGRASGKSRSYAEIVQAYRAVLAGGATAGRFAPSEQPAFTDAAAFQKDVVARWSGKVTNLARAVASWPEPSLDTIRLPHPLLGKLTVREMLLFTYYHHEHHEETVKRRLHDHRKASTPSE